MSEATPPAVTEQRASDVTPIRWARTALVAILVMLMFAAGYTSLLIVERQAALQRVSRYNVTWLASQASTELVRFQQRVVAFAVPGSQVDKDEVQLRLDILANRVRLLQSGEAGELIRANPDLSGVVVALDQAVTEADGLLDGLEQPAVRGHLLALIDPLVLEIARLAAATNRQSGDLVAKDQRDLSRLHWLFSSLLIAVLVSALLLLYLVNRMRSRFVGQLMVAKDAAEAANAASATSRRALLLTLDNMSQGLVMIDADGRIPVVNRRAVELLNLPQDLLDPGRPTPIAEAGALGLLLEPDAAEAGRVELRALNESGRIIETLSQRLQGGGLVRTFTDVTERRIAEARIRHMAHHDPLTGLANRVLLNERLGELAGQPNAGPFGLVCLDLDGFKTVNDSLGHNAGDRLLQEVSRRLQLLVGDNALLARTGGDEFALLCADGGQPEATEVLAAEVLTSMREPIDIDGTQFRLSASLGVAFHPEDGTTEAELLKNADIAMYQAKERGRGLAIRFDREMDRKQRERGQIERDLRSALRNRQIEVWFQPRFDTHSLTISGFEALARWRHPEVGFISPSQFIPVAEQCGMIAELGMGVLADACRFAARLPDGRIAVNLSPVQFLADNLADLICEVLDSHRLTSDRLELEITEGVLIADETQALQTLNRLHDRGLHLALDDFGTGYSSLSYLRRFPFDRFKIDQSFVRAQEHDTATRAIIESVLTMARRLRLEVTAEGVETERQLNLLRQQGCPEVQGYFLGRPMPADEARAFYAAHVPTMPLDRKALNLTAAGPG